MRIYLCTKSFGLLVAIILIDQDGVQQKEIMLKMLWIKLIATFNIVC
jgi:hypothetical protein